MRWNIIFVSTICALVSAHPGAGSGRAGLPELVGGSKFLANLKDRDIFTGEAPSTVEAREEAEAGPQIEARVPNVCGPGVGNCAKGYCCSAAGYCGTTEDYCAAPDCQFQYGPACDANIVPPGASTSGIPRPKLGSVVLGGSGTGGVQDCVKSGVIAFSYDDGPYLYTKDLLDLLDSYGAKATFFITGNNLGKGEIDNCDTGYPQLIKRMYNSGHQVASHTWSHQDLSTLTAKDFDNQVYYNEMAFRNILGLFPTYLRPPYSSCNDTCSNRLKKMGYHSTYFDLDTEGYLNDSPELIQNSKNIYTSTTNGVDPATNDFLLIEHDIHYQTVYNLTKFILDTMASQGWGAPVTVGECLNDPATNWYRSADAAIVTCAAGTFTGVVSSPTGASSSSSSASGSTKASSTKASTTKSSSTKASSTKASSTSNPAALKISTDGTCDPSTTTCQGSGFGNCCSQYGYCGGSADYCGAGCQSSAGSCGSGNAGSSSTTAGIAGTASTGTGATVSPTAVSVNGLCGSARGTTCAGSAFGNCCSQYGFCGSTSAYCGQGCQVGFGSCA